MFKLIVNGEELDSASTVGVLAISASQMGDWVESAVIMDESGHVWWQDGEWNK